MPSLAPWDERLHAPSGMPNGYEKGWTRFCLTVQGFHARFDRRPSRMRLGRGYFQELERLFTPGEFGRLRERIELVVVDEDVSYVAEDGAGHGYGYGADDDPAQTSGGAEEWLQVTADRVYTRRAFPEARPGVRTSASHPIRVDFLPVGAVRLPGRLGLTLAPGKKAPGVDGEWERDLVSDLSRLKGTYRATVLVSLLEEKERQRLGIADLPRKARDHGLTFLELPIPDGGTPTNVLELAVLVSRIIGAACDGQNVVIHCRGGLGRSGLVGAACLVARGESAADAVRLVRECRPGAVETPSQEAFLDEFEADWRASRATSHFEVGQGSPPRSRFRGCLLGGALGDALGYPIEFEGSATAIHSRFGSAAPGRLAYAGPGPALISDDTQMTLFAAEGLVRAAQYYGTQRGGSTDVRDVVPFVRRALVRWLLTQEERPELNADQCGSALIAERGLHTRRAPGNTNLTSLTHLLRHLEKAGTPPTSADNDSKGCGAVMRSAPFGLVAETWMEAFDQARESGYTTHGHPSGYLSAAFFAGVMHLVARGDTLEEALDSVFPQLEEHRHADEVLAAIVKAREVASRGPPAVGDVESLGEGWVAEEALAIALACALTAGERSPEAFAEALWRSVVHRGDSDSTGSLTGNLLGAIWGVEVLPTKWLGELELRHVVERVADDLHAAIVLGTEFDVETYPRA